MADVWLWPTSIEGRMSQPGRPGVALLPGECMKLDEILTKHKRWVESEGKEGVRADLRKAILQEADLHDVNLQGADLEGAHLSVADLMGTNLRLANLKRADLWMADMKHTILQGAELQGANLAGVTNLTQKQIDSAIVDDSTVLPAGIRR